jgi:hypothetical protein
VYHGNAVTDEIHHKEKKMKKVIELGKVDFNGRGRKVNMVTIEVELKKSVFSVCGNIWNGNKTDVFCGGQCLDTIKEYIHTPAFSEIHRLWKLYHLNDLNAGTIAQAEAVDQWQAKGNKYDYVKVCEYLKSIGLYEVDFGGKPYRYGSGWIFYAIPENDLQKIKKILAD